MAEATPHGKGTRPNQYDRKLAEYTARGKHAAEIEGDVQRMIDDIGWDGADKLRAEKIKGHPTKHQQIVRDLSADQILGAVAGKHSGAVPAAFKGKDLTQPNVETATRIVLAPFVYMFKLPTIGDKYIRDFAKNFCHWAKTHMPNGIPILDHCILVASFCSCLVDGFRRKRKGEPPHFGNDEPPEPVDVPQVEPQRRRSAA